MGKQEAKLIFDLQRIGLTFWRGEKSKEDEEEEEEGEGEEVQKKIKKIQVRVCLGIMGIWIIKVWYGELVSPLV